MSAFGPLRGPVLVTGGAGFVGTNVAKRLLDDGHAVRVFDDLSRPGVERNLAWLQERHAGGLEFVRGDVRDAAALKDAVRDAGAVVHLAAQVAVTSSLDAPVFDLEANLLGTFRLLEALRSLEDRPPLLFTSTNKVYGDLAAVELVEEERRYAPRDERVRSRGVDESTPLDFHSPYGCSKGAADQYVLDYVRSFGLQATVFRMSCIYGPHQFGTEDQGWVAHFLIRALEGETITLFGDGKQVRDILYVDDLVDAMALAFRKRDVVSGRAFNIGGGARNSVSLRDVIDRIAELHGTRPEVHYGDWRTGDQRYYVSDTSAFERATGWRPAVGTDDGLERLYAWLRAHRVPAGERDLVARSA